MTLGRADAITYGDDGRAPLWVMCVDVCAIV